MPDERDRNDNAEAPAGNAGAARLSDPVDARKKAMDWLARRDHGRRELERKLAAAGFTAEIAERAVDGLAADGLQDDARYIEEFIRSRIERGKGPYVIRSELSQRGVDDALIDDGLEAAGADWVALARAVRRRKFGPELPVAFRDKARQMRFLQYRGFGPEQIRAAVGGDDD